MPETPAKPQPKPSGRKTRSTTRDRIVNGAIMTLLWVLHRLPFRLRVPFSGWVLSTLVAPVLGYRKRIRANLKLVMPDLPEAEIRRMERAVPNNIGRTIAELYSPDDLVALAKRTPVRGPGLEALKQARAEGRPSILVSGHFGNYDIVRAGVINQGFEVGGVYRKMNNPFFHEHYLATISKIGLPLFGRGRRGMAEMVRFLRKGGTVAMLIDQRLNNGVPLKFFGHTAYTALSVSEMALKYNATMVPCYGIRQADGVSYETVIEAPIPHTTPEEMTQALNDSLEAQVRQHMDQWFWIHNRWKEI